MLILVVLSLLILLVVIAVMFVVVASRARAVARVYSNVGRTGDTPEEIVYGVALDLVRGSLNPHSPFSTTSLLEDMYGQWSYTDPQTGVRRSGSLHGVVKALAPSVVPSGAGGLVDILAVELLTPKTVPFSPVKDAYSGCVLTFVSGPAKGASARILEYWPVGTATGVTDAKFRLLLLRNDYGNDQLSTATFDPKNPPQFIINGRPFSGTGAGYNPLPPGPSNPNTAQNSFRVNALNASGRPYALLPNPAFFMPNTEYGLDPSGFGGANEDYDAPDFQNPFLAFYSSPNIDLTIPNPGKQVKPSFHDPALLGYWATQPGAFQDINLVRQILFRPNQIDHPVFATFTNPEFTQRLIGQVSDRSIGPWDIDNDGDGLKDSIWVDPGYPVQMTAQGKLYKPLAAVLLLDLDGRLNVNAHGSLEQLITTAMASQMPSQQSTAPLLAGGATMANPPRGSGYGPAEIRIDRVLPTSAAGILNARYGLPSAAGAPSLPGAPSVNDPFSAIKLTAISDPMNDQWPGRPAGVPGSISLFGTPPDVKGMLAVALDPLGQPVWDKLNWNSERIDNPYEIDLSRSSARGLAPVTGYGPPFDSPFSIGELELVLRPGDIDSGTLPNRLRQVLTPDLATAFYRRNEVTTDSWDLPVPSMLPPVNVRRAMTAAANQNLPLGRVSSMPEMLYARLVQGGVTQADVITRHIDMLLAPDVRRGLRMDINRPFGNGVDDSQAGTPGFGIVDDASETLDPFNYQGLTGQNQSIPLDALNFDHNGDGQQSYHDRYLYDSRQILARHLYVLMMLFTDDNFAFPVSLIPGAPAKEAPAWGGAAELDPATHTAQLRELKANRLAQWAINVVDFRDPDNIMTPFPFDMNPFNGWDPSGPERGFVWGCETPVALLTETLAFHDRRVKDTDHDGDPGPGTKRDHATNPDPTLDQPKIPRGSAFVEIMSIFSPNAGVMSRDLFDFVNNQWVLDLGKLAPDGKPVWRLAITEFHSDHNIDNAREKVSDIVSEHPDTVSLQPHIERETPLVPDGVRPRSPWNFSLLDSPIDAHEVNIERIVWFANKAPTEADDIKRTYYPSTAVKAQLHGFQYAVVGPGGTGAGERTNGTTVTGIMVGGRDDNQIAGTQQIRLGTPANPNVTFVGTANDMQANIKDSIGIPVASPAGVIETSDGASPWGQGDRVGFSISEPLFSDATHYYPKPDVINVNTNLEEDYGTEGDNAQKYLDQPLDGVPGMPLRDRDMTKTGTYSNVRTVFLQRLADPTRPYHGQMNPYITVDWMPFDLTVFNGEDRFDPNNAAAIPKDGWDPDDSSPDSDTNPDINFSTRERGRKSTAGASGNTDYNIWTPVSQDPVKGPNEPSGPASNYFRHKLVHTLGYLNSSYGAPQASPNPLQRGGPAKPFPWIRWANRPFSNALELMEVPASTAARLCLEFNYVQPANTTSPYLSTVDPNPFRRQFNHLLNFFRSTDVTNNPQPGGDFYRIFDFIHVPSPFVGTETMLDPAVFHTPDPNNASPGAGGAGTEGFRAPFNWVSNYRDPGKINLNTINSPNVWNALTALLPGPSRIPFGEFWATRRGGTPLAAGQILATPVPGVPSIMPSPYRSGGGGDMVPDLPGASPAQRDLLKRKGVNLTLLRETPSAGGASGMPHLANPGRDPNANFDYANADRNAAFRYQQLERLANLTTTRSNVYAIWVTVGYFEVFPNPGGVDAGHPDGYQLGVELGSDSGQVERHRGFYILDRSIPVGFERGFNHNVEKALVLKRFIE